MQGAIRSLAVLAALVFGPAFFVSGGAQVRDDAQGIAAPPIRDITVAELPQEARETLSRIRRGGPFPYPRDGAVFGNHERILPAKPRGYYREYTVPTPGLKSRGSRRIIAGSGGESYYTDDHYASFRRIRE